MDCDSCAIKTSWLHSLVRKERELFSYCDCAAPCWQTAGKSWVCCSTVSLFNALQINVHRALGHCWCASLYIVWHFLQFHFSQWQLEGGHVQIMFAHMIFIRGVFPVGNVDVQILKTFLSTFKGSSSMFGLKLQLEFQSSLLVLETAVDEAVNNWRRRSRDQTFILLLSCLRSKRFIKKSNKETQNIPI